MRQYRNIPNLEIEDAHVMFRNFQGRAGTCNREGDRNFCVRIDDEELAEQLKADGWNIKEREPRDEDDETLRYLSVKVNFDSDRLPANIPPMAIWMIKDSANGKHRKILLDENTAGELDHAFIKSCDLVIRPYQWEVQGKEGVSAYLQTGYFVIETDRFADKYADEEAPEEVPWD